MALDGEVPLDSVSVAHEAVGAALYPVEDFEEQLDEFSAWLESSVTKEAA